MTRKATAEEFADRLAALADMRDLDDREAGAKLGLSRHVIATTRRHHPDVEWTGKRRVIMAARGSAKARIAVVGEQPVPEKPRKTGITLAPLPWEQERSREAIYDRG